jgi:TPR repeat protein
MLGHRNHRIIGLLAWLLLSGPVLAAPDVVVLGGGTGDDPVAACGDLAASPFEPGRAGRGLDDGQIFIDGAIAACEAALAADPKSAEVQTWLARAYLVAGRIDGAASLLQSASDAGSPFAAYLLSGLSEREQDIEGAIALLGQAADGGFAPAQSDLAERFEMGNGVTGDYMEAQRLYQAASDQGHGFATYKLGYFEHAGYTAAADFARAMELYGRAAALGEPLGYNGIGQLYEFGQGVDQDYVRAAAFYQLAADAGEKMSQTALAYFYEQGLGVAQDYNKSFALLFEASAQDWGYAHAALSIHYLFGQGTAVDEERGFELAWRAKRLGIVYAEGILGYLYQNGIGTVRDLSSARFHFQDGANGGDQYSADQLAVVDAEIACRDAAGSPHEPGAFGRGVAFEAMDAPSAIAACENALQVNPGPVGNRVWLARALARAERHEEAVPLLEEGVAAGNVLAHTVLGDLLIAGAGIDQDQARAISLYEAVAEDFGPAQLALGLAYAHGLGVPQDREQALHWLRLAESFGVAEAVPELTTLLSGGEADAIDLAGFGREGPGY